MIRAIATVRLPNTESVAQVEILRIDRSAGTVTVVKDGAAVTFSLHSKRMIDADGEIVPWTYWEIDL